MKRDNVNYLAAGSVVVLALAFLFMVLYKITGRSGDTDAYYAYYDFVAGLRYGTPVYFEGYRVGQVEDITPERSGTQTRFRIDFTVEVDWPIPEDSVAEIATAGLLSDTFIVLEQGESETLLQSGAQIQGREAADIFGALNDLAGDVSDLTESRIEPLLDLLAERFDSISANLETNTPLVVEDLRELLSRLNDSANQLNSMLSPQNAQVIDRTLANFEQTSEHVKGLAAELDGVRDEVAGLIKEFHNIAVENRTEVRSTVAQMETSIANLSRRLDSIGYNLDEASRNFNEFTRAIRQNPNRLIFSSGGEQEDEQ